MGACQSRQSAVSSALQGCFRKDGADSDPAQNAERSVAPPKSAPPTYLSPVHTPPKVYRPDASSFSPTQSPPPPPPPLDDFFQTPSESTATETEEPSPEGTMASLYLASPLQTVIFEEEDKPDQPSDEEDSVYQTNDVPLDEASGSLRKFRTSTTPRRTHIEDLPPPTAEQSVNENALSHFKQLKLQAKLLKKSKQKQRKHQQFEDRIQDIQAYRKLWTDFQDIEDEVSSIDGAQAEQQQQPPKEEYQCLNEMYFDFNSIDFGDGDANIADNDDDASQVSQSNLSLLSEQSLEAQRRYYSEKRRQKKKSRKKKKNKSSSSVASSASSVGGSVCSAASRDYGPVRRNLPQPSMNLEESVLRQLEVTVLDRDERFQQGNDDDDADASYVSDLGDDMSLVSNTSSLNDYGVPRRRQRGAANNNNNTQRPSHSLQSTLESLENAVAGLQERNLPQAVNDSKNVETGTDPPPSDSEKEQLIIVECVTPTDTDAMPGITESPQEEDKPEEPPDCGGDEHASMTVPAAREGMDFEPQVDESSYASSPELLLEAARQTLSKRGSQAADGSDSGPPLANMSPISDYKNARKMPPKEPWDTHAALGLSSEIATRSDPKSANRAEDPPGEYNTNHDESRLSSGVLDASYATGDESSVLSDFGDLRAMASSGSDKVESSDHSLPLGHPSTTNDASQRRRLFQDPPDGDVILSEETTDEQEEPDALVSCKSNKGQAFSPDSVLPSSMPSVMISKKNEAPSPLLSMALSNARLFESFDSPA